jgi:hypothetical protein
VTVVEGVRHVQLAAVNCDPNDDCLYTGSLSIASVTGRVLVVADRL